MAGKVTAERKVSAEPLEARIAPAAVIVATLTDGTNSPVQPGGNIHYTEIILNTAPNLVGNEAINLQIANALDPNLVLVPGSLNISPLALDDTFSAVGNTQLFVNATGAKTGTSPAAGAVGNIFANDMEFENDLGTQDTFFLSQVGSTVFTGSPVTITTTGGGSVTVNADGSFVYTPATSFTGADTFTYTLRDDGIDGLAGNSDDLTGTGTVTINVANKVWYVDSSYGGANGGSDGSSTRPFTSLTPLNTGGDPDGTGDTIYLREAGATYTAGITLEGSQTLHGSHTALTVGGFSLAAASAAAPILAPGAGVAITLASGNTLTGFTVGNSSRDIVGLNFGTLTVSNVTLNGSGKILDLENGTLAATFNSVATTGTSGLGANGHGMRIVGVGGTANFGSTTIAGTEIQGIFVNNSAANLTFGNTSVTVNSTTANVEGIRFENNATGTRSFGTLTVASTGPSGIGMQIADASGTVTVGGAAGITSAGNALVVSGGAAVSFQVLNIGNGTAGSVGGAGITLNAHTAAFSTTGGTIQNVNGTDVNITGGTGVVTLPNTINNTAGGFISIDNHETGNITISGNLSSTSGAGGIVVQNVNSGTVAFTGSAKTLTTGANNAVTLASNAGATINFSGATAGFNITTTSGAGVSANNGGTINFLGGELDLETTSGAGFSAVGGGTVAVQGSNNTINTGTGTALQVSNTTIAAAGLTFRSISANGAASGIILNTTGSSGGLTVTGDGGSTNNGSGGTIQNTTGHGISLNGTRNVSFDQLNIQNTVGSGIEGTGVVNFTLTNSTINNSGTGGGADDSNVAFNNQAAGTENNLSGTVTITNNTLTNSRWHGIMIQNFSGTLSDAIITGNTITSSTLLANSLGYAVNFQILGSASTVSNLTKATISNNAITNFPSAGGIQVQGGNSNAAGPAGTVGEAGSATNIISITNNSIRGESATNRMGTSAILYTVSGKGQGNVDISNNGTAVNPLAHTTGTTIGVGANGNTTLTATTNNNFIESNHVSNGGTGISGGAGVTFGTSDAANMTWTIQDNVIRNTDGNGILAVARGASGTLKLKIIDNDVEAPMGGVRPGIRVDAGNAQSIDDAVYLEISGNTSAGSGGSQGIGLRKQGTNPTVNDFAVRGMSATGSPGVEAYIASQNPAGNGCLLISATSGFTNWTGTGGQPPFNPLMFAPSTDEVVEVPSVTPPPTETPSETTPVVETPVAPPPIVDAPVLPPAEVLQDGLLSQEELAALVNAAIATWEATGLSAAQSALLRNIVFEVADFSGRLLGQASPGHIILDSNGASMGWYVDANPLDSSEFNSGNTFVNGHLDAFTTVLHELGHVLGIEDTYDAAQSADVMYGFLHLGERRLPTAGQAEGAAPDGGAAPDFVFSPISGGRLGNATGGPLVPITLPGGKGLTVVFDATVPSNTTVTSVSTRGTITADGGISVLTDDPDVGGNQATVTQIDLPDVSVAVSPISVTEDGAGNLIYTFTRTGANDFERVVNFAVTGNASALNDYALSSGGTFTFDSGTGLGTITFAANSPTFTLTLNPTTDTTVENDETAIFTVTTGTGYQVGTPAAATGTIANDDTDVSVTVAPSSVTEDGAGNLVYTFTRAGVTTSTLTANFSLGGTVSFGDYSVSFIGSEATFDLNSATGTITFAAGVTSVQFTVDPIADNTVENDETAIATVTAGTGYNVAGTPATGTITNDDADVTLAVSPASVTEDGLGNLVYTFTRTGFTGGPLTVNFGIGGTATSGSDYTQTGGTFGETTGTVTFATGQTEVTVTINPTADTTVEDDETVVLSLLSGTGYNVASEGGKVGTILNDDTHVTVAVAPASVTEDGAGNLIYTFTRTGVTSNELVVQFSLSGAAIVNTDYTVTGQTSLGAESGTITFAAGVTEVTLTVNPTADTTVELDESVNVGIISSPGYTAGGPATGTIANDDTDVSVTVEPASVFEDGLGNLVYTFTRSGVTTGELTVNFSVGGDATFNTDYTQSGAATFTSSAGTVTFAPGATTVTVTVDPTADNSVEGDETAVLTITAGTGYNLAGSPATGTINNDDATVTVAVSPASVTEDAAGNLVYTFTRTGYTGGPLTVNFNAGGTATLNTDYATIGASFLGITGAVNFAPGSSTATVTVDPTVDTAGEGDETVLFTLNAGSGYVVGTPGAATGTIIDDDTLVSVAVAPASVTEASTSGLVYTFTRTGDLGPALLVNFSVAGAAAFTTDYTQTGAASFNATTGTISIPAGQSSVTVTLVPVNDRLVEGDENVLLTLTTGAGYGIVGSPADGLIDDNDTATISFGAATSSVSEGGGTHNVGVVLTITADGSGPAELARPVSFNVVSVGGGTATPGGTDYAVPALLTFASGTASGTSQNAVLTIANDRIVEGAETATLGLTLGADGTGGQAAIASGAAASHTATINDNDTATIAFDAAASSAGEAGLAGPVFVLTITADGSGTPQLGSAVTFNVTSTGGTALNGTDYILPGTITFGEGAQNGATTGSELGLFNDRLVEGDETAILGLAIGASNAGGQVTIATGTIHTLTIQDNDTATIGFATPGSPVNEGAGTHTLQLVLNITANGEGTSALAQAVSFNAITLVGGNATDGADYNLPAAGTFAAGSVHGATQNVATTIVDDTLVEGNETAIVGLSLGDGTGGQVSVASGAAANHTIGIIDNDVELVITKTDGVTTEVPGTTVTYVITVSNPGLTSVDGATVADTFANILTGITWSAVGVGGANGFTNAGSGNINDTAVNLPTGSSVTYTVTGTILSSATGTLVNTATVAAPAGFTDPNSGNNSATDTDTLTPQGDLIITKTDGKVTLVPGTSNTYTISVSNTGPSDVVGASIQDLFPAGFNNVTFTAIGTNATGFTASGNGNINDTVNIASGGTITYTVIGDVASSLTGTFSNTATITAPGTFTDTTPGNNSATDTDTLTPQANLQVTLTDAPDPVIAGTNLTYTVTLSNLGPSDAQDITLSDAIPAGTTFVSLVAPAGWSATTPPVGGTGTITITSGSLATSSSATFTIVVSTIASLGGNFTISDTATVTSSTFDVDEGNNSDTETTAVITQADLAVTKIDSVDPVYFGTNVTYTITVRNNGASDAQEVSLVDLIPAGMTFVSASLPVGWSATTPAVGGTGTVTFTTLTLAAGGEAVFTVVMTPTAGAVGTTVTNTATVTSATTDPNAGNNSDSEPTAVGGVDLIIVKDDGLTTVTPGGQITYLIGYGNDGQTAATNVVITETLPVGTTFNAAANPGWTQVGATNQYTYTIPTVGAGVTGVVSFVVNANSVAGAGQETVENTVTIADDGTHGLDVTPADNTDGDSTTLNAAPDLVITLSDSPATALRGRDVSYTLNYSNVGNQDATGTFLTITLPANTFFNPGASTAGWFLDAGNTYKLPIGNLAGGGGAGTAVFTVEVANNLPGGYTQLSTTGTTADDGSNGADLNPANNTDTETTPIYQGIYVVSPGISFPRFSPPPVIRVFDIATGVETQIQAYEPDFRKSIRVAVGDVNGDGYDDIITSTISGTGRVRVFDGVTGQQVGTEIDAFPERGARGAYVAAGDLNGDGRDEIIVGSGYQAKGKGMVKVFSTFGENAGSAILTMEPFGNFKGGVRVASGDVNGDGIADIIASQGYGGNDIKVTSGLSTTVLQNIQVGGNKYKGGVFVAAAEDLNNDGKADIIAGRDRGQAMIETFSGANGQPMGSPILPFGNKYKLGVRVAAADVNLDGVADIIAGSGGKNGSLVKFFDGVTRAEITSLTFAAYPSFPQGSLFVAGTSPVPGTLLKMPV